MWVTLDYTHVLKLSPPWLTKPDIPSSYPVPHSLSFSLWTAPKPRLPGWSWLLRSSHTPVAWRTSPPSTPPAPQTKHSRPTLSSPTHSSFSLAPCSVHVTIMPKQIFDEHLQLYILYLIYLSCLRQLWGYRVNKPDKNLSSWSWCSSEDSQAMKHSK